MTVFKLVMQDGVDGSVDLSVEGYEQGDPMTDASRIGVYAVKAVNNLYDILASLHNGTVEDVAVPDAVE